MGITGSGKSTKARTLASQDQIFSTDDYWIKDGQYVFEGKKIGIAHSWNKSRVEEAMKESISPIVVDNTNITKWEREPYINMAKLYDYDYEIVLPDSPWFLEIYPKIKNKTYNDKDIKIFVEKNTHGVPIESVRKMCSRWEE